MTRPAKWILGGSFTVVAFFMIFPILIVFPISLDPTGLRFPPQDISLDGYRNFFTSEPWLDSIRVSIIVAAMSTVIAVPLGVAGALALVRSRIRGKGLATAVILAPLMVPHITMALAYFFFLRDVGLFGTQPGLAIVHSVIVLPFVVLAMTSSLKGFDEDLEIAAMTLGATWRVALWRVTFPMVRTGLIASSILAFLISFDEVIIALFVTGAFVDTLPKRLFGAAQEELDPLVSVVSSVLVMFSAVMAILISVIVRTLRVRSAPDAEQDATESLSA